MPKKLTMKQWENSKMDKQEHDKVGNKYGKEGSKTEQAHDRAKLAEYNKNASLKDVAKTPKKLKKR